MFRVDILKQQSHKADIVTSVYSPDGSILATGSVDGKVKVWDARSGQCFVTFGDGRKNEDGEGPSDDHPRAAVSDLTFTSSRGEIPTSFFSFFSFSFLYFSFLC